MRLIKGIVVAESGLNISHLQFADDIIIFLDYKVEYAVILRRLLWCFMLLSGLSINFFKSKVYQVGVEAECARQMAINGVVSGKTRNVGCGGVLRDSNGLVRGVFYGPLGVVDSNIAEMLAIKIALQVFLYSPWIKDHALIVESDSKVAVEWICNKEKRPMERLENFQ
ncbi:hypothetical protein CRYUN_Cryun22dG0037900 [Craigia yunnanensis]